MKLWSFKLFSCFFNSGFLNYVPTYLLSLRVYMFNRVPKCLRAFVFYMATYLHTFLFYVSTCLCDFEFDMTTSAYVPICFTYLCAYVLLLNYVPTWTYLCVLGVYKCTCFLVLRVFAPVCLIIYVTWLKKSLIQQLSNVTLEIPAQFSTASFSISRKIAKLFKEMQIVQIIQEWIK